VRIVILLLGLVLAGLQYRLWLADDGFRATWGLQRSVASQEAENEALAARNDRLAAEVRDLKQGLEAVEEIARNDLGMIVEGETFYQVAADEDADGEGESSGR
jgi:cell division protein FtsB